MPNEDIIKEAADLLDQLVKHAEAADKHAEEAESEAKQAKEAAANASKEHQKTAAAEEAEIGQLAKQASDALMNAGLLGSQEKADEFASLIRDPKVALAKMAQLTQYVKAPKLGSVVVEDNSSAPAEPTADERWDMHMKQAAARLGL